MKCLLCEKKVQTGQNVSYSHRKTKRNFKPNILKKTISIAGKPVNINICTKCYKKSY